MSYVSFDFNIRFVNVLPNTYYIYCSVSFSLCLEKNHHNCKQEALKPLRLSLVFDLITM